MRIKKKRNILLKLIILTIILSIALPFSISLAAISDQIRLGENIKQTNEGKTAVRDGLSCTEESVESMELNVRSNSIKGVNSDNGGGPFYCMFHGRALTYFNKIVIDTSYEGSYYEGIYMGSNANTPGISTGTGTSGSISDILSSNTDVSTGTTDNNQTLVGGGGSTSGTKEDFYRIYEETYGHPYVEPQRKPVSDMDDDIETHYNSLSWSEYKRKSIECKGPIEPSVGYAIYYIKNQLGEDPFSTYNYSLQQVIWASRGWGNESNVLYNGSSKVLVDELMSDDVRARAYQYGTVYYEILKHEIEGEENSIFKVTPDEEDTPDNKLKVMVDKTTGLYTVGPYKLKCQYGSQKAKQILYNEIIGSGNKGYFDKTKFAVYNDITNINYDKSTFPEFLREDGTRFGIDGGVSFPDFVNEENFYIRFKPSEEGAINRLSESSTDLWPVIHMKYLKEFSVDMAAKYESTELQAHEVYTEIGAGWNYESSVFLENMFIMADKSLDPDIKYGLEYVAIGGVDYKEPHGCQDDDERTVSGKGSITKCVVKFTTKSGRDPKLIEIEIPDDIELESRWQGTYHEHCVEWSEDGDDCEEYEHDYGDGWSRITPWYTKGQTIQLPDIVVEGVTLQPLLIIKSQGEITEEFNAYEYVHIHGGSESSFKDKEELTLTMDVKEAETEVKVGGKRINMQLGGYVWIDHGDAKTANFNNLRETQSQKAYNDGRQEEYFKAYSYRGFWDTPKDNDKNFNGILVELYDQDGEDPTKPIAYTTTDLYGRYRFYGLAEDQRGTDQLVPLLNPLHNYFIKFKFNGQLYTQLESDNDGKYAKWTGDEEGQHSSADEISRDGAAQEDQNFSREAINDRFETIQSQYDGTISSGADNNNYNGSEGKNKVFAMFQKIETGWGEYSDIKTETNRTSSADDKHYVYGSGNFKDKWAYAYGDAWDDFIKKSTNIDDFENPDYMDCTKTWFTGDYRASDDIYERKLNELKGKWGYDGDYVAKFIKDCLMKAKTISPTYTIQGDYDKFVINNVNEDQVKEAQLYDEELASTAWADFKNLYTKDSDQSRYINYGMHERQRADLAIQKDVFNAKVVSNGEMETYDYRSKNMEQQASDEAYDPRNDNTTWNIYARRADMMYKLHNENGTDQKSGETAFVHPLEIRRADYLKTWTEDQLKNLKIIITYRIAVKNQGSVPIKVEELADYYDSNELEFDGDASFTPAEYTSYNYDGSGGVKSKTANSYLGSDANGGNAGKLTIKTTGYDGRKARVIDGGDKYHYDTLFLTNINNGAPLAPGDITFVYISFRVKNAEVTSLGNAKITDKPILDIDFNTNANLVGKRNIVEVNSYSTKSEGDKLNYGFIDIDSNPGSLDKNDLNEQTGNIKINNDPLKDHQEDDTDEAPNLRIRISTHDDIRVYTGYAFEDDRNEEKDKALVGDGKWTDGEAKINGVTMQVWMLQRDVDAQGIFTGKYKGSAQRLQKYFYTVGSGPLQEHITDERYATGSGDTRIVFDSDIPVLRVGEIPVTMSAGDGQYAFASLPSGDYFVRFIYGDTYETVLTNNNIGQEVKDIIDNTIYEQDQENTLTDKTGGVTNTTTQISKIGLNAKSYNGQDYKSTVYQGIETDSAIPQTGSYNGIRGFTDYNKQNYSLITNGASYEDLENAEYQDYVDTHDSGDNKDLMYYYDIAQGDSHDAGLSDAKDVYYYRWKANNYGRGTKFQGNEQETQRNTLMEILSSWERVQTYPEDQQSRKTIQQNMLKELMDNTKQVAQTGIISTMGEYNTTDTDERNPNNIDSATNEHGYIVRNLNLGIVERPEAQLKLTKKISNFQVTLANGQVLFDASKTVKNLYMAEHKGHLTFFANADINRANLQDDKYKYNYWSNMIQDKENGVVKLRGMDENLYDKLNDHRQLRRLAAVVTSANSKETPELLQVYMDDELMEGAKMQVRYEFLVENAGEVDYLDKQFYYVGKTNNTDASNVSRTNPYNVVDYVSNLLRYDQQYQDEKDGKQVTWRANSLRDLTHSARIDASGKVTIDNSGNAMFEQSNGKPNGRVIVNDTENDSSFRADIINRKYANKVKTYNQILLTDSLRTNKVQDALLPVKYFDNKEDAQTNGKGVNRTTLILSTELSTNNTGDNLVYNNMTELVETQNSVGRRMQYSIVGNQPMSDQSLRNDASITDDSSEDLVTPVEIDADSAQKIVITKPTGEFKNYTPIIIVSISAFAIIAIGAILIRKVIVKK